MLFGLPILWLRKSHWRQRTLELLTLLRDVSKSRRCCVSRIYFQLTCLRQIEYRHLLAFILIEFILNLQTRFVHELTVLMHDLYQVGVLIRKLCILVHDLISKEFLLSSVWPAILHHQCWLPGLLYCHWLKACVWAIETREELSAVSLSAVAELREILRRKLRAITSRLVCSRRNRIGLLDVWLSSIISRCYDWVLIRTLHRIHLLLLLKGASG